MVNTLKRKSADEECDRPTKTAKLELGTPSLFGALPYCQHAEEPMEVDMDAEATTPTSAQSSPVTTPSSVLPSYPTLQIYTPLNPLDSSTPLDTPATQLPFFESMPTTPADVYPQQYAEETKLPMLPTSSCGCERIPRLHMSCPKPNGDRSLWSICDRCGAIGIVA